MPEAAEVEIVTQGLQQLINQKLVGYKIFDKKLKSPLESLINSKVTAVSRHGKQLGIEFGDKTVAIHLRLAGRLVLGDDPRPRAELQFSKDKLSFADVRRFATLKIIDSNLFGDNMGPDLLDDSIENWLPTKKSRRAIKTYLLDQTVIAGIGNYLIDEALWKTKHNPTTPATEIKPKQVNQIVLAAREVALSAVALGGMSMKDYVDADGKKGTAQNTLKCYGRQGKPCLRCKTDLVWIKVNNRGTTFCPECQK